MKLFLYCLALLAPSLAPAALKLHDNGAAKNFLFEKDPKALATEFKLMLRSGSLGDPKGQEGLSRLAFRSLLRGTKTMSKEVYFSELERLGATIDVGVFPGRTNITLYSVSHNLEKAIQMLADTVLNSALTDEEIEAVKQEELGLLNQELTQNSRIMRRIFRQAVFQGTPLAIPPEGTIQSMKSLTPEMVRGYLAERLKAGSIAFAVSSNRSAAELKSWTEKAFASMPEGKATPLPAVNAKPPLGRTVYVMERKGSSTSEIGIGHLGIKADRKDQVVLETGLYGFGEDMGSRIFLDLREKRGWTYGADAGFKSFDYPRAYEGAFLFHAFPQSEFTEPLTLRALELFEEFSKNGLTKAELQSAKKSLSNSYPFYFATSRTRLNKRLYQYLEGAPLYSVPEYRKLVGGVTESSLKKSLRKVLDPKNVVIVIVGDPANIEGLLKKIPNLKQVVKITDPMQAFGGEP